MMNEGSIKFYDEKETPHREFANTTPSINALEEKKAISYIGLEGH